MEADPVRILGVGAHPDDLEVHAGGTLARYARDGHEVFMAVCTDGAAGHLHIPPEHLAEIRKREFFTAAEAIGAQHYWMGEPDGFLFENEQTRLQMIEIVRWANPHIIITHHPDDYHPDHRAASRIVFGASFMASTPARLDKYAPCDTVAGLFYMDTTTGIGFDPDVFVDVSETFATKMQMVSAHRSQVTWLRDHDGMDLLDFVDDIGQMRGQQVGVAFAEGFDVARVWPRVRAQDLLPCSC